MPTTAVRPPLKPRIFKTGILFLNLLAAVFLLISQVSPNISPARFWLLEPISLSYPFLLAANLIFMIYWLFRFHRFVFISAAVIIMGYDKLSDLYQPSFFRVDVIPPPASIKVMSYNVKLFDLYNWTGNYKTRNKIFEVIKKEQPSILCVQEYFHSDGGKFQNNVPVADLLNTTYSYIQYGITLHDTNHWGMATFSKYPIVSKGKLLYEEGRTNFCIYTDLKIEEDTIRVYNVHLQSHHFKENDYKFLENPDSASNGEIMKGVKNIGARVKKAAVKRANQVDVLKAHMQLSPYPYIICGDFNDPPFSYAYQTLRKELKDSFTEKGKGFGITYRGNFPPFRIDFILHHDKFMTHKFQLFRNKLSDHYPVMAWLTLPGKKKQKIKESYSAATAPPSYN